MLPAAAYTDPTCWRGSRSTSSTRAGCAPVARPTSPAPRPAGRPHRHDRRAATCVTTTVRCGRSPTSAGTAATSCCPAVRHDGPGRRPMPVPRLELRARRRAAPRAALRRRPQLRAGRQRPRAVPHAEWGGWVFVNVDGGPARSRTTSVPSVRGGRRWRCERLVVAASHEYDLEANWKIARRTTTSATTARSSIRSCAEVSPSRLGGQLPGGQRRVGRRRHGPDRPRRDDDARRPLRAARDAPAGTRSSAGGACTSGCSRTCW